MTTRGITFIDAPAPVVDATPRLDAALVVGLAEPRPGPLPAELLRRLSAAGFGQSVVSGTDLVDVPVAVSSWAAFDALFISTRAIVGADADRRCATAVSAAVRAFFAHGGRELTVIALGAPPAAGADEAQRIRALDRLLFGSGRWDAATQRSELLSTWLPPVCVDAGDPTTWRGLARLEGLPEPALVLLPDLADLTAAGAEPQAPVPVVGDDAVTICCAPAASAAPVPPISAPRHDEVGFAVWVRLANHLANWIAIRHRTVQLVLAAPLAEMTSPARRAPERYLRALGCDRRLDAGGLASAFVVLAGGWLAGVLANDVPEGLLPADGVVAGLLAANARGRGAWRSATGSRVQATAVEPRDGLAVRDVLASRLCLVEPTPGGMRLGSDVTTSDDPSWRPGMVCRLLALVLRLARRCGEEVVFAPSGEATWRALVDRLSDVLERLERRGALAGNGSDDAFTVTCDRTTMTQSDIDAGRMVTRVVLRPTVPVEAIDVLLAGVRGGTLSAVGGAL